MKAVEAPFHGAFGPKKKKILKKAVGSSMKKKSKKNPKKCPTCGRAY